MTSMQSMTTGCLFPGKVKYLILLGGDQGQDSWNAARDMALMI